MAYRSVEHERWAQVKKTHAEAIRKDGIKFDHDLGGKLDRFSEAYFFRKGKPKPSNARDDVNSKDCASKALVMVDGYLRAVEKLKDPTAKKALTGVLQDLKEMLTERAEGINGDPLKVPTPPSA